MFVAKIVVASCRYIRSCSVLSLKDEVEVDIANFSGYANSCSVNCLSLVRLFLDPVFSSDISSKIFKKIFLYSFFALFFTRSFRLFVRKLITRSLFPLLFPSRSLLSLAVFRAGFVLPGSASTVGQFSSQFSQKNRQQVYKTSGLYRQKVSVIKYCFRLTFVGVVRETLFLQDQVDMLRNIALEGILLT